MSELMQALAQAYGVNDRAQMNLYPLQAEMQKVNTFSRPSGHAGNILEGLIDGFRRPGVRDRYESALLEALRSQRGVDSLEAQLQAMQEAAALEEQRAYDAGLSETEHRRRVELQRQKDEAAKERAGMRKPDQITVNTGDKGPQFGRVDPGYVMKQDENGGWYQETIPGSDAHRERIERENKLNAKDSSKAASDLSLLEEVDYARGLLSGNTAGLPGAVSRVVPGSGAVDFEAAIKPILAGLSFDSLQTMRDNSPTGGALGAISERELDLLQSTVAGYDPNMSEQAKARFLDKIERHYQNWYKAAVDGVDPYGEQIQPAGNRSAYEEWKAANGRS